MRAPHSIVVAATLLLTIGAVSTLALRSAPEEPLAPALAGPPARAAPPCPLDAVIIAVGDDLQARVDAAPRGGVLALAPGVHAGNLVIREPVTLWGPPEAIVRSKGDGSTITIEPGAAGSRLSGFSIDGSGGRFDLLDAAVRVHSTDCVVEGLRIEGALFGILSEQSERIRILGNQVVGSGAPALGLRGDGVRLWETTDSVVEGNHIIDCRDVVVWYSSRNRIALNMVERSRYGTHFMYSHGNQVHANRYDSNVVGVFIMYSHGVEVTDNLMSRSSGAAGMGIGLKESGDLIVTGNSFLLDTVGIYIDLSPLQEDEENLFENNLVRLCDTGVAFHSSTQRNVFVSNAFKDCRRSVAVAGRGDALEVVWEGNYWDDYTGYDLDDDGVGDLPHVEESLRGDLVARHRDLSFFRGMPALALLDIVGHVLPLYEPRRLLVDEVPATAPPPGVSHAR